MKKINFILILKLSKIYYFGNEMYYHAGVSKLILIFIMFIRC